MIQNYKDIIIRDINDYGEYYLGLGNQELEICISEYEVEEKDGRLEITLDDQN